LSSARILDIDFSNNYRFTTAVFHSHLW